jgi:hypothetical protein
MLLDRQPSDERTKFKHRLRRHTIALHLEGANTRSALRYDGGAQAMTGSTLGETMLAESQMPISEIALAAGFADQSHMTRHFRRFVGTTPRCFRNEAWLAVQTLRPSTTSALCGWRRRLAPCLFRSPPPAKEVASVGRARNQAENILM